MRKIKPRQRQHDDRAGEHKQRAGDDAAFDAMEQPADIGCKLLRLGPGQQHAVIERMEITRLIDPLFLIDENAMHHRNLRRRPAEGEDADFQRCDGEVADRGGVG